MHFPATWATLRFSLLLWLPLVLLEITRPFEISTLVLSPVTRTTFSYALLIAVLIAGALGGFAAAMAAGRDRITRSVCGQAAAAGGAFAFLWLQPRLQPWAMAREVPPHLGSLLALFAAGLAGGVLAWILSSAPPRAWRRRIGLVATVVLTAGFAIEAVRLFSPESSLSHGATLLCGALALAWLLRGIYSDKPDARIHGPAADLAIAVLLPVVFMIVDDPGATRLESPPPPVARADAPNIVLIVVDTLRADYTNLADAGRDATPRLAEAASTSATRFTQAWSAAPNTIPSIKALYTAQLSSHFGGEAKIVEPPPLEAVTLAETLRQAGYATAGYTANGLVSGDGFEQGFAQYRNLASHDQFTHSFFLNRLLAGQRIYRGFAWMEDLAIHKERSDTMVALAQDYVARDHARPFFLYLHLLDPHWPYHDRGMGAVPDDLKDVDDPFSHIAFLRLPPPNPRHGKYARDERMREMKGRYEEEIRATDRDLGRLLARMKELGLDASTLVVLVGDHGEEFFEHFAFGHGQDIYVEQVHVPLVMLWPRDGRFGEMPERVDRPVSLLDVKPTLLDLLDLPMPEEPTLGRSLVPLLQRAEAAGSAPPIVAESRDSRGLRLAYRKGDTVVRFAYVHEGNALETADARVFDLASDPAQQAPIHAEAPEAGRFIEAARRDLRERGIR